jgi:hypothetical protein
MSDTDLYCLLPTDKCPEHGSIPEDKVATDEIMTMDVSDDSAPAGKQGNRAVSASHLLFSFSVPDAPTC